MQKSLLLLLSILFCLSLKSQSRPAFNGLGIAEDSIISTLQEQVLFVRNLTDHLEAVDIYLKDNLDSLKLMAITSLAKKPVEVLNREWPEEMITSINFLENEDGKIYYYAEYPFSESGDWSIGYQHYFDDQGRLFAFKRTASFFNSECSGGAVFEESVYIFNQSSELISKSYRLENNKGEDLSRSNCYFPYDYPFQIHRSRESLQLFLRKP